MMKSLTVSVALVAVAAKAVPRKIFLDTDAMLDCDDAGAVAVLHALADNGECEIVGMTHNAATARGVGALSAINTYYGRRRLVGTFHFAVVGSPEIPLGAYKGDFLRETGVFPTTCPCPWGGNDYVNPIATHFPTLIVNASQVPDAVDVYRTVLYSQPDDSVTISSVGFLTNLYDLLLSEAGDSGVPLSGRDLIRRKVHAIGVMGGAYPSSRTNSNDGGAEFNFGFQPELGPITKYVVDNWPEETPMIFSGFEYGVNVLTGAGLTTTTPASNPVREAYDIFVGPGQNRNSWDQITSLFAVRDFESDYYTTHTGGSNHIFDDGSNEWRDFPSKPHQSYIVANDASPHLPLTREVDALMEQMPQIRGT